MDRTRTRPTRSETRDRILRAAADVFIAHGYDGASLDEIAAAAGLTKGAVYSSFAGKDDLFAAVAAERLDQRLAAVAGQADTSRPLQALFAEAEVDLAELFRTQRDWQQLFVESWTRAMRDPDRRTAWADQRRAIRAEITAFFDHRAAESGTELGIPAADLALAAMALSNGLAMEYIADPDAVDPGLFARVLGALVAA